MPSSKSNKETSSQIPEFSVKKLQPVFVDEVSNISIAPSGACRVYFATWSTDDKNQSVRVDAEVIMTLSSLKALATALPNAIKAAEQAMANSIKNKEKNTLQ